MNALEMLRVIWINLMQNKFKVMLTSLGIIVGAVTIVLVIAIGRGGEAEIAGRFGDLSASTIYVNPDHASMMLNNQDISSLPKLTEEIMEQVLEENPYLTHATLLNNGTMEVTVGSDKDHVNVAAVMPDYETVSNLPVAYGDNILDEDMEDALRVAVIGEKLAEKYFGIPENAVGSTLKIRSQSYRIVGVLARKGDGMQGLNPDSTIFVPYSTAMEYIFTGMETPQIVALARDVGSVQKAMDRVKSTLTYVMDDSTGYVIEDAGSRMDAALSSARTMKMLLISVAAIVFVVGGIGIMNVLFVSVKERTREIGILKALGSAQKDILLQFLLESVGISLFGGIAGVILSYILLPLMRYTDIPVLSSLDGQLLAMFFAVGTGVIFGIYPAYKASRLIPIHALNHE